MSLCFFFLTFYFVSLLSNTSILSEKRCSGNQFLTASFGSVMENSGNETTVATDPERKISDRSIASSDRTDQHIWGHFLVKNLFEFFWQIFFFRWIMVLRQNFKILRCLFFFRGQKFWIGQKFLPSQNILWLDFQRMFPKNRSFFEFDACISPRGVSRKHHLIRHHFGDHVA